MYMQVDLYKQMEDRRRAEKRRDAELSWLLKQGKRYPQHWLPRQGCWVLCQAGRWMVVVSAYNIPMPLQSYSLVGNHPTQFSQASDGGITTRVSLDSDDNESEGWCNDDKKHDGY